jgi:hypothetical protein
MENRRIAKAHSMHADKNKIAFGITIGKIRELPKIFMRILALEKFFSQTAHSACHAEREKAKHARTAGAARKFILS